MRYILIIVLLLGLIALPVSAMEFTAPTVPESGEDLMPAEQHSFGKDLLKILKDAISYVAPDIAENAGVCVLLIVVVLLISVSKEIPGAPVKIVASIGVLIVSTIMLRRTGFCVRAATETIHDMSEYGKLLIPVMAASMAAQGGVTASTSIYAATTVFDAILTTSISKLLIPFTYLFLAISVANSALGEGVLKSIRDLIKWLMTWGLKIALYIFTGYISITGVISGATDAAALKATKITISSMVPVVGGILSDASEAVLVSAGVMKNAAGIYGILAIFAVFILPFLQIGIQYLTLKATAAATKVFGIQCLSDLIDGFSTAMGLLLAMTGTVCLVLLISTVCFMKGVGI